MPWNVMPTLWTCWEDSMAKNSSELQTAFSFQARPERPSIILEAGAGTGKTTEIVRRVLTLLLDEPDLDPSCIVLMTFTEKAAGEIEDRIREGLSALHSGFAEGRPGWYDRRGRRILEVPADRLASWEAASAIQMGRLDRIHSQTIHSFCQTLLRLAPLEAGIDPQFRIVEGFERQRLYNEIYDRWTDHETRAGAPEPQRDQWALMYEQLGSLDRLRAVLFELLPKRDLVTDSRYSLGDTAGIVDLLHQAHQSLRELDREILESLEEEPSRRFALYLAETPPPEAAGVEELLEWLAPLRDVIPYLSLRKGPRAVNKALRLVHNSQWKRSIIELLEEHRAATVLREMGIRFFRFLDQEKAARGVLDFDDLLFRTRDLLRNSAVLADARKRYRFLFVDEFQDTDRVQAEIVRLLATDREGHLVAGRTVLVGDPKQAIYSFRRADPQMYAATVNDFRREGAALEYLDHQYRSDPALVRDLNEIFVRVFGEVHAEDGPSAQDRVLFQPRYKKLKAAGAGEDGDHPRIRFLRAERGDAPGPAVAEARAIAAWLHAEEPDGTGFGRYAILLRRLTRVADYVDTLERAGIPVVLAPTAGLLEQPAVVDLVTVLRAVAWPFDQAARLSAARSSVFALTDDEILVHHLRLTHAEPCSFDAFHQTLSRWRRLARHEPIERMIETILRESGLETLWRTVRGGDRALGHVERLLQIAAEYDRDIGGSLRQFVDELSRRRQGAAEMESPAIEEPANAVRILTVHGSKGLEFDRVILPDLSPGVGQDVLKFSAVDEADAIVFTGTLNSLSARFSVVEGLTLKEVVKSREDAEDKRLFYVAVTRARSDVLFVCGDRPKNTGFWSTLKEHLSLPQDMTELWPSTEEGPVVRNLPEENGVIRATFLPSHPPVDDTRSSSRLLSDHLEAIVASAALSSSTELVEMLEEAPERLATEEIFRARAGGRNRKPGILLHRVLEVWDGSPDALPELISRLALETGVAPDQMEPVRRRMQRLLGGENLEWLIGAETVGRELPIHYLRDGRRVEGRIDRLVRREGRLIVIDYKTGRPDGERLERDRDQVRAYCEAVQQISGEPCDGRLWYLDLERDQMIGLESAPAESS